MKLSNRLESGFSIVRYLVIPSKSNCTFLLSATCSINPHALEILYKEVRILQELFLIEIDLARVIIGFHDPLIYLERDVFLLSLA